MLWNGNDGDMNFVTYPGRFGGSLGMAEIATSGMALCCEFDLRAKARKTSPTGDKTRQNSTCNRPCSTASESAVIARNIPSGNLLGIVGMRITRESRRARDGGSIDLARILWKKATENVPFRKRIRITRTESIDSRQEWTKAT
jgi:hypothetical protein